MTPLDAAYAAMEAAPQDDAARLRYYERLADGEMVILLESEAVGETLTPKIFDLEDGPMVLVFDLEERLASFTGIPAPYAALPGRVIAGLLAGQGIGLGVNLGVAPSSMLLSPEAVDWLAQTLENGPETLEARPLQFDKPAALPEALLAALDGKLSRALGLADHVLLAAVTYEDQRRGHMLAFVGARDGAEEALARASAEALTFSGLDAGEMDVSFLPLASPVARAMARVAFRFDLAPPPEPAPETPKAPGSDPNRPPILR